MCAAVKFAMYGRASWTVGDACPYGFVGKVSRVRSRENCERFGISHRLVERRKIEIPTISVGTGVLDCPEKVRHIAIIGRAYVD